MVWLLWITWWFLQKLNRISMLPIGSICYIPRRTENRNLTQDRRYHVENVVSGIVRVLYGDRCSYACEYSITVLSCGIAVLYI